MVCGGRCVCDESECGEEEVWYRGGVWCISGLRAVVGITEMGLC